MRSVSALFAIALGLAAGNAIAATDEEVITQKLGSMEARVQVKQVEKSTIEGLYLVELEGGDHLFVTKDASQFIQGNQYALGQNGKVSNVSEQRRQAATAKEIAAIPVEDMIVYPAVDKKATITVFSDPTCPYCKLLHESIPELNKAGFEVRYLAFPRMGLGSDVHASMASAWCSADRKAAMTKLFHGESIPEVKCKNPVADEFLLGEKLGVMGTPTIILENGKQLAGVQTVDQLMTELGLKK